MLAYIDCSYPNGTLPFEKPYAYLYGRTFDIGEVVDNRYRTIRLPHGTIVKIISKCGNLYYDVEDMNGNFGFISGWWLNRIGNKLSDRIVRTEQFLTVFDQNTGALLRGDFPDGTEPTYSTFPELLDLKITNKCFNRCPFCYMNSNKNGEHAKLSDIESIFTQLENKVFSVALGGGEPTIHPEFKQILLSALKHNIVPTFSTAIEPTKEIAKLSAETCGAVAVSYWGNAKEFVKAIERYKAYGVEYINAHVVLGTESNRVIKRILIKGKKMNFSTIFLRFKPVGRAKNISWIYNNNKILKEALNGKYGTVGVDSCLAPIVRSMAPQIDHNIYDFCEAGRFSFYIDAINMQAKECSFSTAEGFDLSNMSVIESWNLMNKELTPCKLNLW